MANGKPHEKNTNANFVQRSIQGYELPLFPKVRTTDNHLVDWNRDAITKQLLKETKLTEQLFGIPAITEEEAKDIAKLAEKHIKEIRLRELSAAMIREIVNTILLERGHPEWRNVSTRVGTPVYDAHLIDTGDRMGFEKNDNANLQDNAETSHKKKADKMCKEQYLLMMPPKLADAHLNGDIHIHDLEYFGTRSFCTSWDLRYFFYYGLMPDGNGTKASVAGPAKKAEVAMLHAVKAMGSAQTNAAGGQGFYNFLTFVAPYFKNRTYKEIEQLMQMFIYEMTQMMVARGGQVVFSSVQLSPGVPKLWRDKPAVYKGKVWNGTQAPLQTYGEFEREVRLGFKAIISVLLGGDYLGKPFNFPKPEISIEPDFIKPDEWVKNFESKHPELLSYDELYDLGFELAAKYGTPYFDNQLPEYRGAGKGISCYQCCAYSFSSITANDTLFEDKLNFKNGKHFSMGAWQVMSLNCPRAAYKAEHDDQRLFQELKHLMDTAVEVFLVKKKWMDIIVRANRMPFFTQRPMDPNTRAKGEMAVDLSGLVYEIGVVGINEMVQHHTGKQMHESEDAVKLAIRAMYEMKFYAQELSKKHEITISLARTPAETTAMRFAVSDLLHKEFKEHAEKVIKGDLKTALARIRETRDLPVYYTNGTHAYVGADIPITQRINIEHVFFPIVDGGNIMHIWMGEASPSPKGLKEFAMNIAKNTQTGYFAFTKDMTICMDDFYISSGLHDKCPNCGSQHIEHISRVTGYVGAVSGWNASKQEELKNRTRYTIR